MPGLLSIGELARRLRVTPRTLRHYESVGLLTPARVDGRTGYRWYGIEQLSRGQHIEVLKAAGLSLATIRDVLSESLPMRQALAARRLELLGLVAEQRRQLQAIESMISGPAVSAPRPERVTLPAVDAFVVASEAPAEAVGRAVRREIQRLRRSATVRSGVRPVSFSATFPLDLDDTVPFEVRAHLDAPHPSSTRLPAAPAVRAVQAGPLALLSWAYDVTLHQAQTWQLTPTGSVVEHYIELGRWPRTEVAVLVERI